MQSKTTLKRISRFFLQALMILGLFFSFSSTLNAQQYINGNLSTGVNSSNGVAAPAGSTWSEVQVGNINAGFGANIAAQLTLADNFQVLGTWTVTKFTFFAYSTGYAGPTSPFEDLRFQIFNTDPSVGAPVPVFGDLTTNRLTATSSANMYRIFNATPGTTRQIWKIEATIPATVLTSGNYWVEWELGVTAGLTSNFTPPSTVVGSATQPGNNSKQHDLAANTWAPVVDGTNAQDQYFLIDYTTPDCTGTPDPGAALASPSAVCPGVPFTVSTSTPVGGGGITYQWQSSTDGVSFTDIPGATNATYNSSLTTNSLWFQLVVNCTITGNSGTSTPVQVALTPPSGCYCTTSVAGSVADEDIFHVTIGTLDNASDCNTLAPGFGSIQNRYSNYAVTGGPTGVIVKGSNPISVRVGTCGGNFTNSVAVFIDANQNGVFEPEEKVYVSGAGTLGPHTETGNAILPSTALLGQTLMRVVNVETGAPATITACGAYNWGETEDYFVTIRECVPVSVVDDPVDATADCGGDASFNVTLTGDNPAFQWERRLSPTDPWTLVTNGGQFSGAGTSTLNITGISDNLSGNQFRVIFTGSCTGPDFTAAATLTVSPMQAGITPNPVEVCSNATSQAISITNLSSSSVTNSVSSAAGAPYPITIPDATPAGIVTPAITLPALPAGAVVTNMSVTFNITHTWVGDLDINLIAPNGQNMNLVGSLNNGTGGNGTDNFTNTVISSTSTNLISGAAAPRTGTFAAERRDGYGPTGNTQTAATTNWSDLLTQVDGDWKLAIADFAGGDEGPITSWSISITYTIPVGASGTWAPTTGLFLDAGLTQPYTGSAVNTVYVAPPATGTAPEYTVTVQTPLCTSPPLTFPVIRAEPLGNISDPADATGCTTGTVSFTADADAGGPLSYQWQESSDGGATYLDVTDGGVYSGTNTNTLTLTNPALSMDGYLYRVIISVNACATSATSNAAELTVKENSSISIAAAPFTSLYPGLQTNLTATITPSGGGTYTWYLNGTPVQGATDATHIVDIDGLGVYTADVIDANGCLASSNSVTIIDSANTNLFIYPNPNTGIFQVRFYDKANGTTTARTVNIYDSKGSRVFSKPFDNILGFQRMDINLSGNPGGTYFVEVVDKANVRLQSGKVVILK